MPDIDSTVPATALFLMTISILVVAIAMDMRRLPLGRVKYMPWTYITITAVFGVILAGRNLLLALTA